MIGNILQNLVKLFTGGTPKPPTPFNPISAMIPALMAAAPTQMPPMQSQGNLPQWVPQNFQNPILQAAGQYGVPPAVLAAMARQESSFNPQAIGPMTKYGQAHGPWQFLSGTGKQYGITNPYDITQSANAAAKMLKENYEKFGTWDQAVMAHHGGPNTKIWGPKTRAYRDKVMGYAGIPQQTPAPIPQQPTLDPRLVALLAMGGM